MNHPPYHLRPNKAVDRHILVEVIKRLSDNPSRDFMYVGFGGPLLEDIRLMASSFPAMRMISIEKNQQTYLRQRAHRASRRVELRNEAFDGFLANSFPENQRVAVWLDYTDLSLSSFNEFFSVLTKVLPGSVVKVTVRCDASEWLVSDKHKLLDPEKNDEQQRLLLDKFCKKFGEYVPEADSLNAADLVYSQFYFLLLRMFQLAAQQALAPAANSKFQILHSCYYSDGTLMLSITGLVVLLDETKAQLAQFKGWKYLNTDWDKPIKIELPMLSVKERLLLERFLPCEGTGRGLQKALGYSIDNSPANSIEKLRQYQELYTFYPQFVRANV